MKTNISLVLMFLALSTFGQTSAVRLRLGTYTAAPSEGGGSSIDTNGWLWSFQMDDTNWTSGPDPYALVLTPTNNPANIAGVLSNAVRIQRANNQILGMNTTNWVEVTTNMNWSIGAWVLLNSLPTSGQIYGIAGKTDPGVNGRVEFGLAIEYNASGGAPFISTGTNASNSGTYKLTSANLMTATNVWTFIIAGRDATVGSNWISVAGAAKEWLASPIGPAPTATPFRVGSHGSATHVMNGNIDKVMFWRTNVDMTRISFLTNNPPAAIP